MLSFASSFSSCFIIIWCLLPCLLFYVFVVFLLFPLFSSSCCISSLFSFDYVDLRVIFTLSNIRGLFLPLPLPLPLSLSLSLSLLIRQHLHTPQPRYSSLTPSFASNGTSFLASTGPRVAVLTGCSSLFLQPTRFAVFAPLLTGPACSRRLCCPQNDALFSPPPRLLSKEYWRYCLLVTVSMSPRHARPYPAFPLSSSTHLAVFIASSLPSLSRLT
ncbi:hypothetical protein E2C01_064802 [Portunus trituberculatus]|uniref:Uncharacterized protein n=1 Tax=Portunus trituberculatus TaxID=210409 RepID=A0A5B7HE13_PORTR|nr:hypothetical protein [Portunus trituberculatus]